jgi:hypothetical protein
MRAEVLSKRLGGARGRHDSDTHQKKAGAVTIAKKESNLF